MKTAQYGMKLLSSVFSINVYLEFVSSFEIESHVGQVSLKLAV